MADSRVQKTLLNAKVNMIFYFLNLAVTFFSRKIFLDSLGAEFFGLTSTIGGFLVFLSLVELGIGNSVGYALYKPMYDKDYKKLNEIVSVLGYLYYIVGFVILGCGIILGLFFPILFEGKDTSLSLAYAVYISYLISVLLTYFVNYRQSVLCADQRAYVINGVTQGTTIVCYLLQMIVVYYTQNPYLWVLLNLLTSIFCAIYINIRINNMYPWLDAKIALGKEKWKDYPEIIQKTKQLFLHKISSFATMKIRPLLMFNFASLESIGKYDNYYLIVAKTSSLVTYALSGGIAGVGNLVAEGNHDKIRKVYWELFSFKFFVAGLMAFGFWHLTDPFIACWLGDKYIMSRLLLFLIIVNEFIWQIRYTTDAFIIGYGLFQDVWAPITEAIISVVVAIVGGYFWGLEGVLLGTIVSMLIIACIWKPYFLFSQGIKDSIWLYWLNFFRYFVAFAISFAISNYLISFIHIELSSYLNWFIYALAIMLIYLIISFVFMNLLNKGMRDLSGRVKTMISEKIGKR